MIALANKSFPAVMERLRYLAKHNDDGRAIVALMMLSRGPTLKGTRIVCGKADVTYFANSLD